MKKINLPPFGLRLFVILFLFLAVHTAWGQEGNWTDYKATGYDSGSGTADKPYIIKTAEQLAYFAARVTSGQDRTACFKLGANIDLSEHFWVPIGKTATDDGNNFSGTFDGHGYVISGMTIKWEAASSGNKNYGFFSQLRAGAQVRNIVFDNARLYNEETSDTPNAGADRLFGVLAGMIQGSNNTEIKNIAVHKSTIEARAAFKQSSKYYVIGGFVGKIKDNNDNCKIANIYVDVDIDFSKMTVNAPNNVFIATFISEYQANVKSSPKNLYVKGNITASAALTFVGPVYGKNKPSATTVKDTWFVESGQQYTNSSNGNALVMQFSNQGTEVTNYEQTFMASMNTYVSEDTNKNLLEWKYEDGKLSFGKVVILVLSNALGHTSKKVEYYVKVENPNDYNYTWTVGGKDISSESYTNDDGYSSVKVSLSNQTVEGNVKVTKIGDSSTSYTLPFTIAPKYYSIDLYDDKYYESGEGTKENPYVIATDLQLAKLAREVNTSGVEQNFVGKYFVLSKDIDLSSALWMPIGTWNDATNRYFYGKFDGKGHTIKNMRMIWEAYNGKWCAWGLFSRIQGKSTTEAEFASITNLVIDNALVEKKADYNPVGNGINIGVALGQLYQNAEISNIIIRKSTITDNEKSYAPGLGSNYRIGGVLGNVESGVIRIFNLASYVTINMFQNKNTTINSGNVYVGGGIGRIGSGTQNNALNIYPANIYVYGPEIVTNGQLNNRWGAVVASTNNPNTDNRSTWYYVNDISGEGVKTTYGTQKKPLDEFGSALAMDFNQYIDNKSLSDKKKWVYSTQNKTFYFSSSTLTMTYEAQCELTASTPEKPDENYYWYVSKDKIKWDRQTTKNTEGEEVDVKSKTFSLPYQDYDQYVYAELVDGTSGTDYVTVPALRATAVMKKDSDNNKKYNVTVTNTIWKYNDYLAITYAWTLKLNGTSEGTPVGTNSSCTLEKALTTKDKLVCHVTVKSNDGRELLDKDLYSSVVVYLQPAVLTTDEEKKQEKDNIEDASYGYDPNKPMKTWKGAYSKLQDGASWDENVIVLMGESTAAITNDANYGFNLTDNTKSSGSMLYSTDWPNKETSVFFRNTTITGKWEGNTYTDAIIQMGGENIGLPIWGDTRFENLTFKKNSGSYDILYCQYNNLEMGEGVKMLKYTTNSPGYGTIGSAYTTSFQVFGGINNDGRFQPLNTKELNEKMEKSLPHGKEGFKMVFKSGHYSTICVGGRQTIDGNNTNVHNGMMGTANMPIKCTIEMDIDRGFNDAPTSSTTKPDFDAGIILAGNHEGAMYGDVDIIVKSGKVGRIVGGTLGNQRTVNETLNPPYNTYMGRVNILLDPYKSRFYTEGETTETTNGRIMVTELYGGSCGRGFENGKKVDNPFYGTSTVTINGGTFQRLEKDKDNGDILCGIFGAGAGGMNGIGDDTNHTPDTRIAYLNGDVVNYGSYTTAKGKFAKYHCYNADTHTFTDVDPEQTCTRVIINGGVFGSSQYPIDGIYGGGSGYMAKGLWTKNAIPNKDGGNIYGKSGQTVASLTINGGEFYCTNGVFAGGRGTNYYYAENSYGGTASEYTDLGKIFGNVEMNINGGTFHCPVFGGGYGVADAKLKNSTTETTLSDMALITGRSIVRISGGTFYKNVYGGGDMARIVNEGNEATYLEISGNADVRGAVFAAGNGREKSESYVAGKTLHPELVGKVTGNTNVSFYGTTTQAPYMYGDIFGGGNLAYVDGDTYVNIYAGNFAGEIFGGGNGLLAKDKDGKTVVINSADVTGNTSVMLAQDQGGQEEGEGGTLEDQFSINVIWDKLWDSTKEKFYGWAAPVTGVEEGYYDKSKFWDGKKFLNAHNIYGGGKNACVVGKYTGEPATLTNGTGTATVTVQKGMTPYSLLKTEEWKKEYTDNANPHFYVFGGGYGENTKVGNTEVTVNVEGEYGDYSAEVDDEPMQMARPAAGVNAGIKAASDPAKLPVFDNSKGIPNFTVLGVLGGGYAGTVTKDAMVTVDGKTFLHRVYGGGFGDPAATDAANTTGQVLGDAKVFVNGAHIYGDVFGGGAGVAPKSVDAEPFSKVARVYGTTMVQIGDDARIYGKVYGGGDMACVGPVSYTPDYATYATMPESASTLNAGEWTYKADYYRSFVNIIGGDIFGEVYGGGKGLTRASSVKYNKIGRIEGNTLVHIAETPADGSDFALSSDGKTVVPYVWNRIYGGCAYGTVDGNAMVHVEGGMLGLNIFGGGYGDVPIEKDATNESSGVSTSSSTLEQVLGKECVETAITSADILGNTKVLIDGGSWIWNRKADTDGNITTWIDANRQVLADLDAFKDFAMRLDSVADLSQMPELQGVESEFFNVTTRSFMKNHNIFGGGNRACKVGKYDNESGAVTSGTGTAEVVINHSPLSKIDNGSGTEINLFDATTLAGLCWYLGMDNTAHPQFSVFGAGYGANTKVYNAVVEAQPGPQIGNNGEDITTSGKGIYRGWEADSKAYKDFCDEIRSRYALVSPDDKKKYYGSIKGDDSDPNTYLRYFSSQLAWELGMPNFTFMDIHGGGFSGSVVNDATVEADCQLYCRNIFGGGLGAKPYLTTAENYGKEKYGAVGGKATVNVKSGTVAMHVFGGGAGVESVKKANSTFVDFPNMARVKTAEVNVYGDVYKNATEGYNMVRTHIYGSIFGGGDIANVGDETPVTTAAIITNDNKDSQSYATTVNLRGASTFSQVYAGGNGRLKGAECDDNTQLGAVYGNTRIIAVKAGESDPYHGASPYLWNRIYGGCKNGMVHGNTLVDIRAGFLAHNIFGGGWGNVSDDGVITSADVEGNANILISGGDVLLTSYWLPEQRTWEPATILGGVTYSPQYDPVTRKFKINHNIYGGGNLACKVTGDVYITMTKGIIKKTTIPQPGYDNSGDYNFFEQNEWKEVYEKIGSPHFAVFGGGYGENTSVQNTHVTVGMKDNPDGGIENLEEPKKGEEYKHYISEQTVMDIVGGGYSGKVEGNTEVTVDGGTFARRIFGGGFYNSVRSTKIQVNAVDCRDIYGGGLMGDVLKRTKVYIGSSTIDNKDIFIHGNVYGGNDVSGYINLTDKAAGEDVEFIDNEVKGDDVEEPEFTNKDYNNGTFIKIRGGHIYGNVYGAGNGDYLYALGRSGEMKVTVNEDYKIEGSSNVYDLVYTVPMRGTMVSPQSASPAMAIVNINSWRPLTNKVTIDLKGKGTEDKVRIDGNVFGGGNSATVLTAKNKEGTEMVGGVNFHIGDNIKVGGIYLGSDGDQLFVNAAENPFLKDFQDINKLSLHDSIDWVNDPSNHGISTAYLPTSHENRPAVYPHLLDLYFQPVEMAVQPTVEWKYSSGTELQNVTVGTFCCGGNRGNMNVEPKNGNIVDMMFPKGLVITNKIVGGCNQANYIYEEYGQKTTHVGGYLLGDASHANPVIKLTVCNDFRPSEVTKDAKTYYSGANVYGGCYETGTIKGNVMIDFRADMLTGLDEEKIKAANDAGVATCNVYGAGYGTASYVRGNIELLFGSNKTITPINPRPEAKTVSKTSANFVFGGGQQGNVVGNTTVRILNGEIYKSVTGASYAGFQWGSTQVIVGYPEKYYVAQKSGVYAMLRSDTSEENLGLMNTNEEDKQGTPTIKQSVNIIKGDIVSSQVYDAIVAKNASKEGNFSVKEGNFSVINDYTPATYGLTWNNVDINIHEAVYGGGYSLATGSSVLANNTTVLKYTNDYNIDSHLGEEELETLRTTEGYGGNTTMLIADHPASTDGESGYTDKEHISISRQEMQEVILPEGTDLFGYYYKEKAEKGGNYRYIYKAGTYFYGGAMPVDADGTGKVYEYDGEGGVFGDGHLSYAQGFRNGEVTGYGYAKHSPNSAKILNTFQRMDMLRLTDNCLVLLGARDYATNATNKTPYSIARVGEIQMRSSIDGTTALPKETTTTTSGETTTTTYNPRYRNYMGLSNNIHYVGAIESDVKFSDDKWHAKDGTLGTESYQEVKQDYIDQYYGKGEYAKGESNVEESNKGKTSVFQKRNDGTAKNMIGIASGYALKIQNVQEVYVAKKKKIEDKLYYGPIIGVVEMRLIDVRQDEGGGYVYADNVHKRTVGDEDFLETTGNFVFPYFEGAGQYIVDDCFPSGFANNGSTTSEIHYWYVTGFNYYYNVHITGYTYDSSTETITFDSDNTDGLTVLAGLKAGQKVDILSWKMRSGHPEGYECDLEKRNYDATAKDHSDNSLNGKYALLVSGNNGHTYSDDGVNYSLPMNNTLSNQAMTGTVPTLSAGDAKISFRLTDKADNTSSDYYDKHLKEPCYATLVLRAPWQDKKDENGKETETLQNQKGYIRINAFYTKNASGEYVEVPGTDNLPDETTYYYDSGLSDYAVIDKESMYKKDNDEYARIAWNDIKRTDNETYYLKADRYYTYTIYLTIEYAQGPDVTGNITINNCALPGEMIKLSTENVSINVDASMSPNGYFWRIGKLNADGTQLQEGRYDTYHVGDDATKTGVFTDCIYNQTENALYLPAYYYMNGYGVQYGFTVNGIDGMTFYVPMRKETVTVDEENKNIVTDTLLVHNFHRMSPHSGEKAVNLHLAEAIARAKQFADDRAAVKPFAEPRIYLSDAEDMLAFGNFLTTIGTGTTEKVNIVNEELQVPRYGENAQFVVQNDLDIPASYVSAPFAGTLHGNGHVVSGLSLIGGRLIATNKGQIYNLGVTTGKIAHDNAKAEGGAYHCCFEYNDGSDKPRKVYRMDGSCETSYTKDDFRYGKVAYDLNQYYLEARKALAGSADQVPLTLGDNAALKYVRDYYANGDYQYARRRDADTREESGVVYLRTGNNDTPGYGTTDTHHDMSHAIDKARAVGYQAATESTPETRTGDYLPLFNAAQQTDGAGRLTAVMNDYLFWGHSLQSAPDDYPSSIGSHQLAAMTKRVWRAVAYAGNTTPTAYHHNAYKQGNKAMGTYVYNTATTAVDFTCQADRGVAYAEGTKPVGTGNCYYPPFGDMATTYSSFVPGDGITRNLLVYTPEGTEADNEAYDAVGAVLGYNEDTNEAAIRGHHVTVANGNTEGATQYLHLVERATASSPNNDFCVPIAFTVSDRAWYTRQPAAYAETTNSAWEGICLPFTANKVAASLNGEITHFYGTPTEEQKNNPAENIYTLHHEYKLRGLKTVATDKGTNTASFFRPGPFANADQTASKMNYSYQTDFFEDTYGKRGYDFTDPSKSWYAKSNVHIFTDYLPLTRGVPYIVSFPGNRYYEFDLSSEFYKKKIGNASPQTVTFNAYGQSRGDVRNNAAEIKIPVDGTKAMQTDISGASATYAHVGTFMAKKGAQYSINAGGTAFENSGATVLPFRTYMTATAASASAKTRALATDDIIYIGGEKVDIPSEPLYPEDTETVSDSYVRVYPVGKGRIAVESTYALTLSVHTLSGQLYRILDVRPGTTVYSGFPAGIYVVCNKKVRVQ